MAGAPEGQRLVVSGEPIADTIKRARLACGLSQHRLARDLVDVSGNPSLGRTHVSRWERGERIPSRYWLPWLSEVLGIPSGVLEWAAWVAMMRRRTAPGSPNSGGDAMT